MREDEDSRSLEQTPTWAVALVCLIFVLLSLLIEHAIHLTGKWLQKQKKRALNEALDKIKAELMLIGFISLLLPIGQKPITMICVSRSLANHMLPCRSDHKYHHVNYQSGHHRKLFQERLPSTTLKSPFRRILYPDDGSSHFCGKREMVSLVSQEALDQLHIFIFVLAVLHVLYSVIMMCLGTAKMKEWKAWELKAEEYHSFYDPEICIRLTHETSFGRRHMSRWAQKSPMSCIECFFRQFLGSVDKVDYLTLRHGFIKRHDLPPSFNFHKYLHRSLDGDFKVVVGVSPPLWAFAVVFLVLNVKGWWTLFWLSFVPLIIIMLIGTKLELVITKMALEIGKNSVVKGTPLVNLDDKLFWFGRPRWVLSLIHFSLFQNAFEIAFFIWTWCIFGLHSCFHETAVIVTRVIMGSCAQVLCSYITLPLYALVSEMGSHMDPRGVFHDVIADAVLKWSAKARKKPSLKKSPFSQTPRKSKSEGDLQQMSRKFSCHSDYEQREENEMERTCSSSSKHSHSSSSSNGMSNLSREEDAQAISNKEEQVEIQMDTSSQKSSPRRYEEDMDNIDKEI